MVIDEMKTNESNTKRVDLWKKPKNGYLEIWFILSVTKPCEQLQLIGIFFLFTNIY